MSENSLNRVTMQHVIIAESEETDPKPWHGKGGGGENHNDISKRDTTPKGIPGVGASFRSEHLCTTMRHLG